MPSKLRSKAYKTTIKPVMIYRLEFWSVRKRKEQLFYTDELRKLRWTLTKIRVEKLHNETI